MAKLLAALFSKGWTVPEGLTDTTPNRFEKINCYKRHQNGNYYLGSTGQIQVKSYWLDTHFNDIYHGYPVSHTGRVSLGMMVFNVFEMLGSMIVNSGKGVYHLLKGVQSGQTFSNICNRTFLDIKKVSVCAYYALGLQIAYTVAASSYYFYDKTLALAMETVISYLQLQWSENAPRSADLRQYYHGHKPLSEIEVFYVPFCMLKIGNLNERIQTGQYRNVRI